LKKFLLAVGFLVLATYLAGYWIPEAASHSTLSLALLIGGYMALTIGANDAANNIGPAVGSGAIPLASALALSALFITAGAFIAGGDVVSTIKTDIIDASLILEQKAYIRVMLSALLAAALWLHLATALGIPVSTTHTIVGGVVGGGLTAGGVDIANWQKLATIAGSWLAAPLLGGAIAALFLYFIKRTITYQPDMLRAARRVVPLLLASMGWAFAVYLILKGLNKVLLVDVKRAILTSLVMAVGLYLIVKPGIDHAADHLSKSKADINRLFNLPLIFAAALLSFAHGANDVANAIAPVAAIREALVGTGITQQAVLPLWMLSVGALGIALGVLLYGPKITRTIGMEITELDQMRAFCVAMAVAITVILASQLGLPVSTTHVVVGAVFGVGFLREYLKTNYAEKLDKIKRHHQTQDEDSVRAFLKRFERATYQEKAAMLKALKTDQNTIELSKKERKALRKLHSKELVKRSTFLKILFAWLITLPVAGIFAAVIYRLAGLIQPL
jgi:PiT family inorganic phosphate transporter